MPNIFDLFKKIETKKDDASGPPEYLLVGLGNYGKQYARTRHNAGFIAVDCICSKHNIECNRSKFKSLVTQCTLGGHSVLLMLPQTLMNNSGIAVREAAEFYKIPPEKVIIIVDDVQQDVGHMRVRRQGTDGGHNGLKSIIYHLESDNFPRIRLGVGRKPAEYDLVDWVLGKITDADFEVMRPCVETCEEAAVLIMDGRIDDAMAKCNGMKPKEKAEDKDE